MKHVGIVIARNRIIAERAVVHPSMTMLIRQLRAHWQDKLDSR